MRTKATRRHKALYWLARRRGERETIHPVVLASHTEIAISSVTVNLNQERSTVALFVQGFAQNAKFCRQATEGLGLYESRLVLTIFILYLQLSNRSWYGRPTFGSASWAIFREKRAEMRKSLWLMVGVLTVTAMVCSLPGTSRADSITVTVNGTQYFVTTVTGTFTDNMAQLESTPWWGDSTLAQAIATAVADDIGTPNEFNGEEGFGPLFAWDFDAVDAFVFFKGVISPETIPDIDLKFTKFTWGEGSAISAAEPSSLSVLFAGCVLLLTVGKAIFDEARRRRQAS